MSITGFNRRRREIEKEKLEDKKKIQDKKGKKGKK